MRRRLPASDPIYTLTVKSTDERLDWREFLARPLLPGPTQEMLAPIVQSPILITGAGGSLGSALALRLADAGHRGLILLDFSENNLLQLEQALCTQATAGVRAVHEPTLLLGDARDADALENLFSRHRPRIVFHAAAYKHVPFLESHPLAAIANNVFSTEAVAGAAAEHGAHVVLLSTDKVVEPASVMGATKRVAEQIVLGHGGTVLRLGNVLGSSGSVSEVFARQIAQAEALTVADPEARRYFLTAGETVNLLFFAAHCGESAILVPALPVQHRIAELAAFMARTLASDCGIPIHYTGLRPGDKFEEKLWSESERAEPAPGSMIRIEPTGLDAILFARHLAALHPALRVGDISAALADLYALVPDYRPSQTVLAMAQSYRERACV